MKQDITYLPFSLLTTKTISNLITGSIAYVPRDGAIIAAGMIGDELATVQFQGDYPMTAFGLKAWSDALGLVAAKARFEVDPTSANAADGGRPPVGALLKAGDGLAIVVRRPSSNDAVSSLVIWLEGKPQSLGGWDTFVSFTQWRIVVENGSELFVVYDHGISNA